MRKKRRYRVSISILGKKKRNLTPFRASPIIFSKKRGKRRCQDGPTIRRDWWLRASTIFSPPEARGKNRATPENSQNALYVGN